MRFGTKWSGYVSGMNFRVSPPNNDTLFKEHWDELVIRFDPESRTYRVMTAVQTDETGHTVEEKGVLRSAANILEYDV